MNAPLVGVAEHYAQFVKLCRLRIEQLGITYETVDAIGGFPARYTAKLMAGDRAMSVYSMFTLARVLALMPAFHHDDDQHALLSAREDWIRVRRKGPRWRRKSRKHGKHKFGPDWWRHLSMIGNRARAKRLSQEQRRSIARRAATLRWKRTANG